MSPTPITVQELDELISRPTPHVIEALQATSGRIAVLGAGGKMGFHLSLMLQRALRELGRSDSVMTVSRFSDAATRAKFEAEGFEVSSCDLTDAGQVEQLPPVENVFFLAGIKFGTSHQPELLHRFNVQMPELVADRYRDSKIVALSTGCVYSFATPESGGSTEQSPTSPIGEYAISCKGREAAFIHAASEFGTESSIIRLNYSIDLRYGVLLDIAKKVWNEQPVDVSMGYANVIWQGDAIAHIIQSLPHASSDPTILNITGPETLHVRDLAQQFGARLGKNVQIVGSEIPTAWLSNASKSHQMFGMPPVSIEQMIDWTADWVRDGGETLNKPTHFEVRDGNY